MQTEVCVIWNGIEAYHAPDCPHQRSEDELGPIMPAGWTAQSPAPSIEKDPQHGR